MALLAVQNNHVRNVLPAPTDVSALCSSHVTSHSLPMHRLLITTHGGHGYVTVAGLLKTVLSSRVHAGRGHDAKH